LRTEKRTKKNRVFLLGFIAWRYKVRPMSNTQVTQKAGTDNEGRNFTVELYHGLNLVSLNCHYFYKMAEFSMNYSPEGDLKEVRHQSGWFVRF
jgi:hypothetical protein